MQHRCNSAKRLLFLFLLFAAAHAAGGDEFTMHRTTIDGGGTMVSAGGGFELSGTIGQPDAGAMAAGEFELTGGFWFEQTPCDCNYDGEVTLFDYGDYQRCVSGPGGDLPDPACGCFDLDRDNDVDLLDIGAFQRFFRGG